jgi:phosphate starvation-inducible PhoH-like protein
MKTISLDPKLVEAISGHADEALRLIEDRFQVRIAARGSDVTVSAPDHGGEERIARVDHLLRELRLLHDAGVPLGREELRTAVDLVHGDPRARLTEHFVEARVETSTKSIVPRSVNQRRYIEAISSHDLVIGIGPAGTGKTYLAVALAVSLLNARRVRRIILARPAVEAGERLGFLPGDIAAKVDPYLRPLYDSLYDLLETNRTERLLEQGVIEVAPLAFMRGRTLNQSFVILDEAQNSTSEQMKMFLTRLGFGSKAVVNGDVTQIDLPPQKVSGLVEAAQVVSGVPGIATIHFDQRDVVRHPLVQRIIVAYDRHDVARRAAATEQAGSPPAGGRPVDDADAGERMPS